MKICQHHNSYKKESLGNFFKKIKSQCSNQIKHKIDKENLWICLTCGNIGCSRFSQFKCAQVHFLSSKHKLTVSLKNGEIFCYECDENISDLISLNQQNEQRSGAQQKKLQKLIEFKEYILNIFMNTLKKSVNMMDIEEPVENVKQKISKIQISTKEQQTQTNYLSKFSDVKLNVFGLSNLGNTCFFNSILQSLYATKILNQTYIKLDFTRSSQNKQPKMFVQSLYDQLQQSQKIKQLKSQPNYTTLINQRFRKFLIQSLKCNTFSPNQIFSSVGTAKSRFKSMAQQDAQQLLRYLLDAMNEGEITFLNLKRQHLRSIQKKFGKKKLTYLENIFGFYLASRLNCLNCKKISWTIDLSLDLNIEILKGKVEYTDIPVGVAIPEEQIKEKNLFYPDKSKKVFALFQSFFSPQILTKNNYFSCEHCKASKAVKKLYIKDPPQILTIVIKRFTNGMMKNGAHVQFPQTLDISGVSINKGEWKYQLYAVVVHQGGMGGGHYISYTRRHQDWYYFSDSHFKKSSWQNVKSCQAYILFYEKTDE